MWNDWGYSQLGGKRSVGVVPKVTLRECMTCLSTVLQRTNKGAHADQKSKERCRCSPHPPPPRHPKGKDLCPLKIFLKKYKEIKKRRLHLTMLLRTISNDSYGCTDVKQTNKHPNVYGFDIRNHGKGSSRAGAQSYYRKQQKNL